MESELKQDFSIELNVRPTSRLLKFGLASVAALLLGVIIFGVTCALGMFAGGRFLVQVGPNLIVLIGPLALFVGIAAAAYPHDSLSGCRDAFMAAAVGGAMGCLSCLVLFVWVIRLGYTGQLTYGWRDLGTILPFYFDIHVVTWLISIGASAMMVTVIRRTPAVLMAVAVICALAVILPAPAFNLVTKNQELTVAMVVPVSADASTAIRPRVFDVSPSRLDQAGANAVAAHVLEALRKAGLPGPYRVAEIDRCGQGKKSLQIIVLTPPVPTHALLPQPDGAELIYVAKLDGWHTIPAQAQTLGRTIEVTGPRTGLPYLATYCVPDATGYGPCPAVRPD